MREPSDADLLLAQACAEIEHDQTTNRPEPRRQRMEQFSSRVESGLRAAIAEHLASRHEDFVTFFDRAARLTIAVDNAKANRSVGSPTDQE